MAWRENAALYKVRASEIDVKLLKTGGDPLAGTAGTSAFSTATMVVGTEAANVINVAIQLKDGAGSDLAYRCGLNFYLSSDVNGDTLETSGPDAIAIGTDGILIKNGADSLISGFLISEADGDIDINMTHAGADTFYLNLVNPLTGKVITSSVITFDATT